jgi:predicted dehydrogenase
MVIEALGRRLRLAVIGGGPGSVIGEVHRIAARRLVHRQRDGFEEIVTRRKDRLVSESVRRVTRLEIGHPEGYLEAFANLYSDFAKVVAAKVCHKSPDEIDRAFPTVEDGVKGLAFVEAAVRSSGSGHWEPVESLAI